MKTYRLEREAWKQLPPTGEFVATRDVNRLIDDVEDAVALLGLLRRGELGIWPHDHEIHGCELCDRWEMVDDFLKEPSG